MRDRLITAAGRLFIEQGYAATTQKQIAAAADVSVSVLFRNFGSKARLLLAVVGEPFDDIATWLEARRCDTEGVVLRQLVSIVVAHRPVFRCLISALSSPDGDYVVGEMGARLDEALGAVGRDDIGARLIVGAICTMTVVDDWFLPPTVPVDDPRILALFDAIASHDPSRPARDSERLRVEWIDLAAAIERPVGQARRGSDEVRSALLESATTLFRERGYSGASYRDIAMAAGTSESVLHRHFGSKSRLLAEAVLAPFSDSVEQASRRWTLLSPTDRRGRQIDVLADLYSTFARNHQLVRILMALAHDPHEEELRGLVTSAFAQTFRTLGTLREDRARAEHVVVHESELLIRVIVAVVMSAATLDDWFLQHDGAIIGPGPVVLLISELLDCLRAGPPAGTGS